MRQEAAMAIPTRQDLAKMLAALPYSVMLQVATELIEMNQDPEYDRKPGTTGQKWWSG